MGFNRSLVLMEVCDGLLAGAWWVGQVENLSYVSLKHCQRSRGGCWNSPGVSPVRALRL